MPVIIYKFLLEMTKNKKSVSTNELIEYISQRSPRNIDGFAQSLYLLEKKKLIKKTYNRKKNDFTWSVTKVLSNDNLFKRHPDLFIQSLYGNESTSNETSV